MRKRWLIGLVVVAVLAGGGYVAADYYANAKVSQQAERFARDMRRQGRAFTYESVKADLLGRAVVMKNVVFVTRDGQRMTAASLAVKDFDFLNGAQPRYADFEVKGAELPTALLAELGGLQRGLGGFVKISTGPLGEAQRLLESAGYKRTKSDLSVSYRYDEATKEFEIRDVKLDIADLGRITFALKLGNVPSPDARGGAQLLSTGMQATLVGASLGFQDRSLVSRLLKAYAAQKRIPEADALARVLRDFRYDRDQARDPAAREAIEAVMRFIERPTEIRIALEPKEPVPLLSGAMGVMSGRLKETFGMRIVAR